MQSVIFNWVCYEHAVMDMILMPVWFAMHLFSPWLVMTMFIFILLCYKREHTSTHFQLPKQHNSRNSFHSSHFITAYINKLPTRTQTTHTKNMFIFHIIDSIFCSSSIMFFLLFGQCTELSSSSTFSSSQFDVAGRTMMMPSSFSFWK